MEEFAATICPFCKQEIKESDSVIVCPSCGTPHHEACWIENKGCAVEGCQWRVPEPEQIPEPEAVPEPEQIAETEETPIPAFVPEPEYPQEPEQIPMEPIPEPVPEPEAPVMPTMFCANCGAPLDEEHEFCPKCGTPKTVNKKRICSNCGAELMPDQDFCPKCGTRYNADPGYAPAAPVAPATQQAAPVEKKKKKGLIPIIAIIAALAIGAVLFFVLRGVSVSAVALNKTTLTMEEGQTENLTCTVSPEKAKDKTLTWTSSDASVATVDNNGLITAIVEGECTITVSSVNGKTDECKVTVIGIPVSSVSFSKNTLELVEGKSEKLVCTITPDNAKDKTLTWKSSNESVATVDKNGLVTAVAEGKCTITVTSSNGKTDECTVIVERAGPDLKALYDQYCQSPWASVGSDGSYLSLDTNPYNRDDSGLAYPDAYYAIKKINAAMGLPESLIEDMAKTTWSMGKQTETFESIGITVSWTYHPDKGLEVTYKLINR